MQMRRSYTIHLHNLDKYFDILGRPTQPWMQLDVSYRLARRREATLHDHLCGTVDEEVIRLCERSSSGVATKSPLIFSMLPLLQSENIKQWSLVVGLCGRMTRAVHEHERSPMNSANPSAVHVRQIYNVPNWPGFVLEEWGDRC
jgi:hypothetical protein